MWKKLLSEMQYTFRNDPGGTRTHSLQLRRLAPYPLGHRAIKSRLSILAYIFSFKRAFVANIQDNILLNDVSARATCTLALDISSFYFQATSIPRGPSLFLVE